MTVEHAIYKVGGTKLEGWCPFKFRKSYNFTFIESSTSGRAERSVVAMLASKMFPKTLRDTPKGAEIISHQLLVRAGFISMVGAGIPVIQHMGLRVLKKIDAIVRQEMDAIGCLEQSMPILHPRELWELTGRWAKYQKSGTMFTIRAKNNEPDNGLYGLSPTAEEIVVYEAANMLQSSQQLPLTLYQIGPKFRDEARPRYGLIRGREFEMFDAYSFDTDTAGMDASFEAQRKAYQKIFERMGLVHMLAVEADSGAIGGTGSVEFMAIADKGEDTLLHCRKCGYGGNREKASSRIAANPDMPLELMHKEYTPKSMTVKDLVALFPKLSASLMVKTIIYVADGTPLAVCIRGDREINEVKLRNLRGCETLELADERTILEVTGAPVGFAGPIGLKKNIQIVFDESVQGMQNFLCGCNEQDYHLLDVNIGVDLPGPGWYVPLNNAQEGDGCPKCDGILEERRGIELGHIFKLQTVYSKTERQVVQVHGHDGQLIVPMMGCYGIGTTRCLQAAIEQDGGHDEHGMIWPRSIAPYEVVIVPTNYEDLDIKCVAEDLYAKYTRGGIEVVLDDRIARFGEKMVDAELIGYPTIIVVGRGAKDKMVEMIDRKTGKKEERVSTERTRAVVAEWRKRDGIE